MDSSLAMHRSLRCGARNRRGTPCQSPAVTRRTRCRFHGGTDGIGAPPGDRNAFRHGRYTAEAIARRREVAVRLALGAGRFRIVRQLGAGGVIHRQLTENPGAILELVRVPFDGRRKAQRAEQGSRKPGRGCVAGLASSDAAFVAAEGRRPVGAPPA